jgi:hypothetical protein
VPLCLVVYMFKKFIVTLFNSITSFDTQPRHSRWPAEGGLQEVASRSQNSRPSLAEQFGFIHLSIPTNPSGLENNPSQKLRKSLLESRLASSILSIETSDHGLATFADQLLLMWQHLYAPISSLFPYVVAPNFSSLKTSTANA